MSRQSRYLVGLCFLIGASSIIFLTQQARIGATPSTVPCPEATADVADAFIGDVSPTGTRQPVPSPRPAPLNTSYSSPSVTATPNCT